MKTLHTRGAMKFKLMSPPAVVATAVIIAISAILCSYGGQGRFHAATAASLPANANIRIPAELAKYVQEPLCNLIDQPLYFGIDLDSDNAAGDFTNSVAGAMLDQIDTLEEGAPDTFGKKDRLGRMIALVEHAPDFIAGLDANDYINAAKEMAKKLKINIDDADFDQLNKALQDGASPIYKTFNDELKRIRTRIVKEFGIGGVDDIMKRNYLKVKVKESDKNIQSDWDVDSLRQKMDDIKSTTDDKREREKEKTRLARGLELQSSRKRWTEMALDQGLGDACVAFLDGVKNFKHAFRAAVQWASASGSA